MPKVKATKSFEPKQPDPEPTLETKLAEISQDISKIESQVGSVKIKKEQDVVDATSLLATIKGRSKRIEELRQFFVKPLNDQVKRINEMFKERSLPLEKAETVIKRAIADYRMEQERIARAEEAKLLAKEEKRIEKLQEQGKPVDFRPVPTVERPDTTVKTEAGKSTLKKVWKFQVVNESLVPREFLIVDERKIRSAVVTGTREIAGVRIYEDFDVNVSARM